MGRVDNCEYGNPINEFPEVEQGYSQTYARLCWMYLATSGVRGSGVVYGVSQH